MVERRPRSHASIEWASPEAVTPENLWFLKGDDTGSFKVLVQVSLYDSHIHMNVNVDYPVSKLTLSIIYFP